MASPFDEAAQLIIRAQEKMIGDVARVMARRVPGLSIADDGAVRILGDGAAAIDRLVTEYSTITGPLGVRLCFQAAKPVLDANPDTHISSFAALR